MKTKYLIILLIFSSSFSFAQKNVADKFFNNYAYIKASEFYENAYNKGDDSEHVLTRLGDCYYNNSNSEKAAYWYKLALEKYPKLNTEYILKYVQTQQSLGNYDEVDKWLTSLNESKRKNSEEIKALISTEQTFVDIKNLELNSEFSDFGAIVYNNKIFFASSRNTFDDTGNRKYGWNDEPFLDIYEATVTGEEQVISNINLINASKVNTKYHEASIALTNDGKTLYFTRDNVNKRNRLGYDDEGTTHLKIYRATLENGSWENIEELPFNDDVSSTGHPTLSLDNKKLYFVSDREGGFGSTDIYVVDILEDGKFSEPKNLGDNINTSGREMFPFIAKDNMLYFSSDENINIGLLDIFKSNILNDSNAQAENLGAPYNSGYDDFAFFIDTDKESGYFSSNRPGGKGGDDIYSFNTYQCQQIIKGTARNIKTNEILPNVTVKLIDNTGKIIKETTSSATGEYQFEDVNCDEDFTILGSVPDYKDDTKQVRTSAIKNTDSTVDLFLTPLVDNCEIVINPIFFDFDKWNIRADSKAELENIVDVMNQHPEMVIKIESHTDSRGTNRYNMRLSDRRAKSTRDYLISRGIDASRFESAIGYGESQLINECNDDNRFRCSEAKHQENRRSHFYIVDCEED
ncbi:hypothetical protein D7030_03480 [Flavobacteriaceae bacterium AU392]|nr:hypothetical protein D1817_09955 [Flavobacteriaceae bacterium]RKM85740.1 hypothetical protein D7030_03480 [Flavobacteriaceae bacterium AU392]